MLHGLETIKGGEKIVKNQVEVAGKKHSVYVVTGFHGAPVSGPRTGQGRRPLVHRHTGAGLQGRARDQVLVEPGAKTLGVKIKSARYVPTGMIVTEQTDTDALPNITDDYPFKSLNQAVVHVNTQLADGYNGKKQAGKH